MAIGNHSKLYLLLVVLLTSCGGPREPSSPVQPVHRLEFAAEETYEERLLGGFYPREKDTGRWTHQSFAVQLDPPITEDPIYLELAFTLPERLTAVSGSVTLSASMNGQDLGSETYSAKGTHLFFREMPKETSQGEPLEFEFELDRAFKTEGEKGERGIYLHWVGVMTVDQTTVFRTEQARLAREGYLRIVEKRDLNLPLEKQNELMRLFHDLDVWRNMRFLGVKIVKNPCDLWMMQDVIYDVRPDFIIETGTYRGGSALYWAQVLESIGLEKSRVLTIDIEDTTRIARTHPLWQKYVRFFLENSVDTDLVGQITEMVKGKKVLVTLDSDHRMPHVLRELQLYSPLVSPGSYIVVEDTHFDSVPVYPDFGPGPMAAVNAFLAQGGSDLFEQDVSREAMVMTFNPGGWLRRKAEKSYPE